MLSVDMLVEFVHSVIETSVVRLNVVAPMQLLLLLQPRHFPAPIKNSMTNWQQQQHFKRIFDI
jgi:hypothetical protein